MKSFEKILAIGMLLFAIGFNLWLYRAEPTALVDPNDNAFQYALVDRTNQIWEYADQTCPKNLSHAYCLLSLLTDHWVPNWAEGYNLPYYYSHVPQILIVGSWRSIQSVPKIPIFKSQFSKNVSNIENSNFIEKLSLFTYYHWIIYLLLCLFPLSVFLSLRVLRQPWLTAGIGALLASQISTDGLYGIDPPSFLWRGWGLSSQLFAMIFMPLALAYTIRWMCNENAIGKQFFRELKICLRTLLRKNHDANLHLAKGKILQDSDVLNRASLKNSLPNRKSHDFLYAILFITLTTMGHLGLGLMLFLSIPVIALTQPLLSFFHQESLKQIWEESKTAVIKTVLLALPPLVLLSYWIVPTVLDGAFHNVSFWDPVWKFNSYGAKEVLVNLWNGALFDWGRLPIYTALVFVGFFVCLFLYDRQVTMSKGQSNSSDAHCPMSQQSLTTPLPFLFLFFLLLYFGKTTWGGILDFIPSMSEFHQHRFIVGVHLVGLFLAPIGLSYLVEVIWRGGIKFSKIASRALQVMRLKNKITDIQQKSRTSMSLSRAADRENLCYAASQIGVTLLLLIIIIPMIYKQTISYGTYNEELIQKSNATYHTQKNDADLLFQTLRELMKTNPGRVYAGRGGAWGKTFEIADTPYFMHLSTYGIPTVLWLPQTWSNNSDTEQYFSEDNESHYELYNIKYVVSPIEQKPQPFWTLIKETEHWKLYGVGDSQKSTIVQSNNLPISQSPNLPISPSSPGYITSGVSPSVVFSDKLSLGNVVRLWIQSPYPGKSIFPELNLTYSKSLASKGEALRSKNLLPHFTMLDEATYLTPDGTSHSLFAEPPQYMTPWEWPEAFLQYYKSDKSTNPTNQFNNVTMNQLNNIIQITSQSNDTDMIFKATVEVKEKCPTCSVILKQTYHPNWKATVRKLSSPNLPISPSSSVPTIDVFPSYVAVRLEEPGDYEVVFTYTPSKLKMFLLVTAVACSLSFCFILYRNKEKRK